MMRNRIVSWAALLAFASAPAFAQDLAAARKIVEGVCQACHGASGNSTVPDYPRLAGQHPDYLAKALRDYKSGARKNAIMQPFAASLSEADIENLAAYFASQPPAVHDKH